MLASAFSAELARRATPERPDLEDRLEGRLEVLWQQAVVAWPGIDLDRGTFFPYLAARWPSSASLEDWLAKAHVTDLYLACACSRGSLPAIAAFDAVHLGRVNEYVARARLDSSLLDDVRQALREKLFVTGTGKIAEYSGRGPLGGWVRVLAVRTAVDLRRRGGARLPVLPPESPSAIDPELGYLAERYRGEVEEAFRRALVALDGEQRTLLRMHFVDAVTLDELARLRKVHRATIARHLAAARETIRDQIRGQLRERFSLSTEELTSMIRLVRSKLEISVGRLLAE
jgi:RNA polymerase sigma-70 factor (ECF subfamily)